jgi:hypothetical protein
MKKLGEMTFEEAMPIYEAWHNKKPLEYLTDKGEWRDRAYPDSNLIPGDSYRVKATKPSINWSHLKPEIVAIAEDRKGELWGYEHVPEWHNRAGVWITEGDNKSLYGLEGYASYVPGTCAPEDSLVLRPGSHPNPNTTRLSGLARPTRATHAANCSSAVVRFLAVPDATTTPSKAIAHL